MVYRDFYVQGLCLVGDVKLKAELFIEINEGVYQRLNHGPPSDF